MRPPERVSFSSLVIFEMVMPSKAIVSQTFLYLSILYNYVLEMASQLSSALQCAIGLRVAVSVCDIFSPDGRWK